LFVLAASMSWALWKRDMSIYSLSTLTGRLQPAGPDTRARGGEDFKMVLPDLTYAANLAVS
jgi:hypothetical protein